LKYRPLGRTGVQLSVIALGSATFGVAPLASDVDRLVARALELGINVIDTANTYGNQPRFDRPEAPPANQRAYPQRNWLARRSRVSVHLSCSLRR
jgi:aryl-alcohol dehydrogenase-like predicted oxidoreductase